MNALFVNLISKSENAWNRISHSEINLKVAFNFQDTFQSVGVCCYFDWFVVMPISFHRNFYCFSNINEIVTAFWNLNFNLLSLSCAVALAASPNLNETRRISKNVVFIWQIWKTIIRLEIDQSHLILSRSIQLEWRVESCLYFCRIFWNNNLSWSFRRNILNNFFENFSVHLLNNIKVVKPRSVFPTVLWWGQINYNKVMRLRPRRFAKFLNCSFVMSWDTWSLKMWSILIRSWENRQNKFAFSRIVWRSNLK